MSLRTLPPEQRVTSRWRRLRYVPISILAVAGVTLGIVGAVLAPTHPPVALDGTEPAGLTPPESDDQPTPDASGLPGICREPVPKPPQEPWLGDAAQRDAAEAVWQSHSVELEEPYVAWQDGWYDWGDVQNNNFSQAIGRRTLSVDEATQWHDYLAGVSDRLDAAGIPFYIVVTPAKWDVYPELMPQWAQDISGSKPLDLLMARYPDLPIVDIRMPMRAAADDDAVFSKTNSHWSDYGAYRGWSAIADCISADDTELGDLAAPSISGVEVEADRNEFAPFGIADPEPNFTAPIYSPALLPVEVTDEGGDVTTADGLAQTDLLSLPVTTRTDGARSPASALVARDSFGNALSVQLQQAFATTWQVRHNFDDAPDSQPDLAALAIDHDADVVILQIAERHLNAPPAL